MRNLTPFTNQNGSFFIDTSDIVAIVPSTRRSGFTTIATRTTTVEVAGTSVYWYERYLQCVRTSELLNKGDARSGHEQGATQ